MVIDFLKHGARCLAGERMFLLLVIFLQMLLAADGATVVNIDPSAFVNAHNKYRCRHGTPNLVWSNTLAAKALKWAKTCDPETDDDGTSLYSTSGQPVADEVVRAWYRKSAWDDDADLGDYARVVWKSISHVGCAMCLESDDWYNVACIYDHGVNMDDMENNVPPVTHSAAECQAGPVPKLVPANRIKLPNGVTILPLEPMAYLNAHNTLRCRHGAPPLVWSNTLAASALEWAKKCLMQFTDGPYGENLSTNTATTAAERVVKRWYNEIKLYNYSAPAFSAEVGHFTQLVWKDSQEMGCAMCSPNGRRQTVMCMYDPPGNSENVLLTFPDNVLPVIPQVECAVASVLSSTVQLLTNTTNAILGILNSTLLGIASVDKAQMTQITSAVSSSKGTKPLPPPLRGNASTNATTLATAAAPERTNGNMPLSTGVTGGARRLSLFMDVPQTGTSQSKGSSSQWGTPIFQGFNLVASAVVAMSVILMLTATVLASWHALHCSRATTVDVLTQVEMSPVAVSEDGNSLYI